MPLATALLFSQATGKGTTAAGPPGPVSAPFVAADNKGQATLQKGLQTVNPLRLNSPGTTKDWPLNGSSVWDLRDLWHLGPPQGQGDL